MKSKLFILCLLLLSVFGVNAQLIQGTIKPGATSADVEIWLKPNFSNTTQFLSQIGLPIAFPSSVNPQPTGLTYTLDPTFVTNFGSNYSVVLNPVATATGGTEKYFNIVLIRGGTGASNPQTWTSGTEFKVLTATFTGSPGAFQAKLADYQDGGGDGLGNFYTVDGNANYYITSNSIGNFYAAPGFSVTGGNASAGYAQLVGACTSPTAPAITNITNTTANINWGTVAGATGYEYAVTTNIVPPASGTATSTTSFNPTGLTASTQYYAHVRTNCGSGNFSSWVTTGFLTCSLPTVSPITGGTTVCTGATTQLSDVTPGGVWSSNNGNATVNTSGLVTGVTAGTATISYAVSNGCGTTTVTALVTINTVPSVSAITGATTVCTGVTTQLADITAGGTWSSNNGNATVNTSGLVTGVTAGTSTISYAVTNGCGTTTVTALVTINTVPSVSAVTGTTTVCTGSTSQLADVTAGGTWSSNNGNATVNTSGLVTGVTAGTSTISYAVTNACGTTTVTALVTINTVPSVSAITGTTTVCTGATTQLSEITGGGTWSSNNVNATVNATGLVTGVTAGTSTISYAVTNACGTTTVTASIAINTVPSVSPITGTTLVTTGNTTQLADITPGGTWSSNNGNATVNATGLVTGVTAGTSTISYAVTNACGTTTVTTTVTVSTSIPNLIQGTIKPGTASNDVEVWLKPNFSNTTQFLAQVGLPIAFPSSANPQPTGITVTLDPAFIAAFGNNYDVVLNPVANNTGNTEKYFNIVLIRSGVGASDPQTWTSGSEFKVLTASFAPATSPGTQVKLADYQDGGSDGLGNFYTVDGNANYYITATSSGNFYASPGLSTAGGNAAAGYAQTIATIGCTLPVVSAITGTTTVCTGSTAQLSDATPGGIWSSNNGNATVNATGLVTGVTTGTSTISYAVTNACGTTTVTTLVTINTVLSVSPITGTTTVCTGATTQLADLTSGGTWSSNNGNATVNATGLVTGVTAGSSIISYAVTNSCGTTTVTATVTINTGTPVAPITGTTTVCTSATSQLSDITPGGIWSSNNGNATVNASGLVTGVTSGISTISYAVTNTCGTTTVTTLVTVNAVPSVSPITGTTTVTAGSTTQLSDATAGGVWNSNNGNATVNASGLVTGVTAGTSTIGYAVTNTCGTTTVNTLVTINAAVAQLIQGTVKPGATANDVEVWLKPNFSNSTQFLAQIGLPITFPSSANPQPTGVTVSIDPAFTAAFGSNYDVVLNPVATATGGNEKYFNIVLIRSGVGASDPQTWTSGTEFKLLTATFTGGTVNFQPKLADYQDGGSDGLGNFYSVDGNANYYIATNSIGNFYAAPGLSTVGGTAAAGYAQLNAAACNFTVSEITGQTNACAYTATTGPDALLNATYTVTATSASTYTWSVPADATIISGQGTASLQVHYSPSFVSGNISVTVTSACGAPITKTIAITKTLPTAPVVSGIVNVCPFVGNSTLVTYTVAAGSGAGRFSWTIPTTVTIQSANTDSSTITVTFAPGFTASPNKQLRVTGIAACGNSPLTIYYLAAQGPGTPAGITGPTNVCSYIGTATQATYTINKASAATSYIWSSQSGTTTITHPNGSGLNDTTVTVSFTNGFSNSPITVQAVNSCGTGAARSLNLVRTFASAPGLITGSTNACAYILPNGVAGTYSISPLAGALAYSWSTPTGSVVTHPNGSGPNDTIITVQFPNGFTNGTITVSATSACGATGVRSLAINKLTPGAVGSIDTIQTGVCPTRTYTYSVAAMPTNTTSIVWTIPAGATITSGQGTTSITVSYPSTAINSTVIATPTSNCGNGTSRSVVVKLPACPVGGEFTKSTSVLSDITGINVKVYPNPSVTDFNLTVNTFNKELIHVRILDMIGRQLKQFDCKPNEKSNFGNDLKAGSYLLEIRQGTTIKTEKLIKF